MPTKKTNTKKVTKRNKVTRAVTPRAGNISLTAKQAAVLQAALLKNGKSYKFLDSKLAQ